MEAVVSIVPLSEGKKEVEVSYVVSKLDGEVVSEAHEKFKIENQLYFVRSLKLPADLEKGRYLLTVVVNSEETLALDSELFSYKGKKQGPLVGLATAVGERKFELYAILLFFLIVLAAIGYVIHQKRASIGFKGFGKK